MWFTNILTNNQMKAHNYIKDTPTLKAKQNHRNDGQLQTGLPSFFLFPTVGVVGSNCKPEEPKTITYTKMFENIKLSINSTTYGKFNQCILT